MSNDEKTKNEKLKMTEPSVKDDQFAKDAFQLNLEDCGITQQEAYNYVMSMKDTERKTAYNILASLPCKRL